MPPTAEQRATDLFTRVFGGEPRGAVRSPGRVNLMGDHTDYNDGFVLPIAIDRDTVIAFRERSDGLVKLASEHGLPAEFDLAGLDHGEPRWVEYVRGVAWALDADPQLGWEGAIATDVPIGAGLSSSASLEVAAAIVFDTLDGGDLDPHRLAAAAQHAENGWVGMECGIMDQLSVAAAASHRALLIDCRSLELAEVSVPLGASVVVIDTGTRRELTSSAYNERRATCERASVALGIPTLRDLDVDDLPSAEAVLDYVALRRVRHVVTENARVLATAAALERGDLGTVGELMTRSHRSLRDDFEASSRELDAATTAALGAPGCFGARLTGAGFGGCAVALVESAALGAFTASVSAGYEAETGLTAQTHVCVPSAGASLLSVP